MPIFDFGAALGGLAQGFRQGQQMRQAGQELDLKRKMIDTQLKQMQFEQVEKERQAKQLQSDTDAYLTAITKPTPAQPAIETEPGDVDIGALQQFPGQPGAPKPTREPSPAELYTQAAMRQGKFFAPSATSSQRPLNVGIGGAVWDPVSSKEVYRNPVTSRPGVEMSNRIGQQVEAEALAEGKSPTEARALASKAVQIYRMGVNEATSAGQIRGRVGEELGTYGGPVGLPPPGGQLPAPTMPIASSAPVPGAASSPPSQSIESPFQRSKRLQAGATKTGTEQAEMDLPLREKAAKYIHPSTLQPASPDMSEKDAMAKGYRVFQGGNPGQFVAMSRAAFNMMDRLEQLSSELLLSETASPSERGKNWAKLQQEYYKGNNAKVREFYGIMKSQLASLAKAAGDAANVAVPEQQFQEAFLPNGWMSFETAKGILDSRRALLRGTLEGALGTKAIPEARFPGAKSSMPPPPAGWRPR